MKKKTLKLDREAIQVLQAERLAQAAGGTMTMTRLCPTMLSCRCTMTCE